MDRDRNKQLEFLPVDKEKKAIERIQNFEEFALQKSEHGYYVCDSGGKDSMVITWLCYLAGVRFEIHHNHTTMDHPDTVYHVRRLADFWRQRGISYFIHLPMYQGQPTSMWKLIEQKGLPSRVRRWCCQFLKEYGGTGRAIITGVRWAESNKRKTRGEVETITPNMKDRTVIRNNDNGEARRMFEGCTRYNKLALNPIIDWTEDDVWDFIRQHKLPENPLYAKDYKRVGCIGCPMAGADGMTRQFNESPAFRRMYERAAQRWVESHPEKAAELGFTDGAAMVAWWISGKPIDRESDNLSFFRDDYYESISEQSLWREL